MYRAALAALRIPEDAEEVAQDAFVRAWSNLRQFRGDASFKTWLLTIAWRRAMTRRRAAFSWWRRLAPVEELAAVAGGESPDEGVRSHQLRGHIATAIEALSPKLRDALLLAQAGDYDYSEIAGDAWHS